MVNCLCCRSFSGKQHSDRRSTAWRIWGGTHTCWTATPQVTYTHTLTLYTLHRHTHYTHTLTQWAHNEGPPGLRRSQNEAHCMKGSWVSSQHMQKYEERECVTVKVSLLWMQWASNSSGGSDACLSQWLVLVRRVLVSLQEFSNTWSTQQAHQFHRAGEI